jgi:hypothetical protein
MVSGSAKSATTSVPPDRAGADATPLGFAAPADAPPTNAKPMTAATEAASRLAVIRWWLLNVPPRSTECRSGERNKSEKAIQTV